MANSRRRDARSPPPARGALRAIPCLMCARESNLCYDSVNDEGSCSRCEPTIFICTKLPKAAESAAKDLTAAIVCKARPFEVRRCSAVLHDLLNRISSRRYRRRLKKSVSARQWRLEYPASYLSQSEETQSTGDEGEDKAKKAGKNEEDTEVERGSESEEISKGQGGSEDQEASEDEAETEAEEVPSGVSDGESHLDPVALPDSPPDVDVDARRARFKELLGDAGERFREGLERLGEAAERFQEGLEHFCEAADLLFR